MLNVSTKDILHHIDNELFRCLGRTADALSCPCYIVGEFVRDLFLGHEGKHVEVIVEGDSVSLAEAFVSDWKKEIQMSVCADPASVRLENTDGSITISQARIASFSDTGVITYEEGILMDELESRDCTINALAVCLNQDSFGEVTDCFEGLLDLESHLVRTPLESVITLAEHPLSMVSCIRVAAQLHFDLDQELVDAIGMKKQLIKTVSRERIGYELNLIMQLDAPSRGFIDLERTGLLELILPEIAALQGRETIKGTSHKDIFYHTLEVLDNVCRSTDNLWLRWAALLHDIGKPRSKAWSPLVGWTFHNHNYIGKQMVPSVFQKLGFPKDQHMKYVRKLVDLHMRPIGISDEIVTDSAVRRLLFEAGEDIDDLMTLCEADITSKNELKKRLYLKNFKIVRQKLKEIKEKDRIRNFQPPVDGKEIMEVFHLEPCQTVGALKSALKDAVLEGKIENTHEAAFNFVLQKAAQMGLTPFVSATDMSQSTQGDGPADQ